MVKKTIILLVLYFFREKNNFPNLTNSQEPEPVFYDSLEPEPLEKKYLGLGLGLFLSDVTKILLTETSPNICMYVADSTGVFHCFQQ